MGVLHQPSIHPKLKRVSRLVILPDYQGIGLGSRFLDIIAQYYVSLGFDFSIVTSAKNIVHKLYNSKSWRLGHIGASNCNCPKSKIDYMRTSVRTQCKTARFMYIG